MAGEESVGRVFILGSANVDQLVHVPQIVRPGETILAEGSRTSPGGKGLNQAVAAARCGQETVLLATVGIDANRQVLLQHLSGEANLNLDRLEHLNGVATGVALIQIDTSGENAIVVDAAANLRNLPSTLEERLMDITSEDVLVCQLEIPLTTVAAGLGIARERGAKTVLNAAPAAAVSELLRSVDLLVVNEIEANTILGAAASFTEDFAGALHNKHRNDVIVTLGEKGAQVVTADSRFEVPAKPTRVVDTTGAGDAFVGALAAALSTGADLKTAVEWGTALASFACEFVGAQTYTQRRTDVEAAASATSH
jgi:ribokinase